MHKAIELGVVFLPFIAYSHVPENQLPQEDHCVGIKFVCLEAANGSMIEASLEEEDFFIVLETSTSRAKWVGDTPAEALQKYTDWRVRMLQERAERDANLVEEKGANGL